MDDYRENFMEDQRTKIASDKASYVPYMEMKSKSDYETETENVEPAASSDLRQKREEGSGLILLLGEEYERRKRRLNQELRQDFRCYVAQKKDLKTGKPCSPRQDALSLPIREGNSAKNRLLNERNKEYRLFLKRLEGTGHVGPSSRTQQAQEGEVVRSVVPRAISASPGEASKTLSPERLSPSRRDAATLTEPRARTQPRGHWNVSPERPERRRRRLREYYSSEEEEEQEQGSAEVEGELLRRRPKPWQEVPHKERRDRREERRYPRPDRATQQGRTAGGSSVAGEEHHQEENQTAPSATPKPDLQEAAVAQKPTERHGSAANRDMAEFATGLMIGAKEESDTTRRRKECYRQELLEQMAERQNNKKKEKELELRVAATGAVDPEKRLPLKQPDRIKQFGAVSRAYEERRRDVPYRRAVGLDPPGGDPNSRPQGERPSAGSDESTPPEKPRVAFQSPPLDYAALLSRLAVAGGAGPGAGGVTPRNEDFHKSLSGALGEMVAPRVLGVPPPLAPTLLDAYRTPYDDAYYYYGARNPLDPSLASYGPAVGSGQNFPNLPVGAGQPPHQTAVGPITEWSGLQGVAQRRAGAGVVPTDRAVPTKEPALMPTKEPALSYPQALRQQILERQEQRRRQREEGERYEAKLEAEMKAYEPWGKGGAGAPLRDEQGNLISDLKRMHRLNEEAYVNPGSREQKGMASAGRPTAATVALGTDHRVRSASRTSGFALHQPSPHARGNIFSELPTPQQLHDQDLYKESLRQQIEEKQRKRVEERERLRQEEEREEQRLAGQRAQIQREYEEEQERRRRKESAKKEELVHQLEERRRERERRKREEEEQEKEVMRKELELERERQTRMEEVVREPSPPVPALRKKLGLQRRPRSPSADSRHSAVAPSVRSWTAPSSPPVPARRNQLRATEEQQGVMCELSALRKQLQSEQRRLEGELLQTDREDLKTPAHIRVRERPPVDVFDMARLRMQVPARRPSAKPAPPINMQNIHEFNQLKNRDSESREQVRLAYPAPPLDDQSLDLQQQALISHQRRRANRGRRDPADDHFDLASPEKLFNQPGVLTHSLLESDSTFIDPHGDEFPLSAIRDQRVGPTSGRQQRQPIRRMDFNDEPEPESCADDRSVRSLGSSTVERVRARNQRRVRKLEHMDDQGWTTGKGSADEDLWLHTPLPPAVDRRASVETVATEPWLRPGTSETLKHFLAGRRPSSRDWDGPSTQHG